MNIPRIDESNLPSEEKANWYLYIIRDRMKVKRMALERERAMHFWDLNREHAKAIVAMRNLGISPKRGTV